MVSIERIVNKESTFKILKKHAIVVKYLQLGQTLPETAKLCGVAYNTAKKVKSIISQYNKIDEISFSNKQSMKRMQLFACINE